MPIILAITNAGVLVGYWLMTKAPDPAANEPLGYWRWVDGPPPDHLNPLKR